MVIASGAWQSPVLTIEIASALSCLAKTGSGCDCFGTIVPYNDRLRASLRVERGNPQSSLEIASGLSPLAKTGGRCHCEHLKGARQSPVLTIDIASGPRAPRNDKGGKRDCFVAYGASQRQEGDVIASAL
jgi:hypothetical protein